MTDILQHQEVPSAQASPAVESHKAVHNEPMPEVLEEQEEIPLGEEMPSKQEILQIPLSEILL